MEDFKLITLRKGKKKVNVHNPTKLKLIGKGVQGAVFQLNEDKCVKIFLDSNAAEREVQALKKLQKSNIVPILYDANDNYVIMEYVKGKNLRRFLRNENKLSKAFSKQIIDIRQEMKKAGFTNIKTLLGHFIISKGDVLKAIDLSGVFRKNQSANLEMFQELKNLGLLDTFLRHTKEIDSNLYEEWVSAINEKGGGNH